MCSNDAQRIAAIGLAIDNLAADALAAYAPASRRPLARTAPGKPSPAEAGRADAAEQAESAGITAVSDADQVVIRLAELWALLAKLDPEVARRLPTYEA
jgi:hypothetical protein